MRAIVKVVFLLSALVVVTLRDGFAESREKVQINKLTIEGNSLPADECRRIAHSFEHHAWPLGELEVRLLLAVRDQGYFHAVVETPSFSESSRQSGDMTVRINAGRRYFLREMRFKGGSVFPHDQLRNAFKIKAGDTFAPTRIGNGLERLRQEYAGKGYVNFVAMPVLLVDEANGAVDLEIQIEEGSQFFLEDLILDGTEPHAGAARAMWSSWEALRGRRFDPKLLDAWLAANRPNCPSCTRNLNMSAVDINSESKTVDIHLVFPEGRDPS